MRAVLRQIETELKGETMTGVLALVAREFFDKLIGHAKVEEAYKHFSSTGAQPPCCGHPPPLPLRQHRVRGVQRHGHAGNRGHRDAGARQPNRNEGGIAFPLGTLDTFVTHGAPANLIKTVNKGRPADLRPPDRPARRLGHQGEDRGLHPADQQAPASGGAHPLQQLRIGMSLFAEVIDDLFADPELARDALWRAGGLGDGVTVRAVVRLADRVTEFGAAPAEGDAITVAGRTLVVQGEPLADAERLVWTLDCREA